MRFLRVRIVRFGPLFEVDSGPDELPGLTVVLGHNEAGKSSFFLALRSLIHGMYPASRDTNPHAPWDGSDLEIEGWIHTRSGAEYRVHRRLLTSPWGRIHHPTDEGERTEDIGNRAIPSAGHIPRALFEHVYAITLPDMARLQEGPVWKELRDRLVVGMGTRDLGSPRRVAEALSKRAQSLWRPDRRSSPRAAQIREELKDLSDRLAEARDRDRKLREVVRDRARLEEHGEAVRVKRTQLEQSLAAARTFRPLETRLEAIRSLRRKAEPVEPLEALEAVPSGPLERLAELEADLRTRREELERAIRVEVEANEAQPAADPLLDTLELRQGRVRALVAARPVVAERDRRIDRARQELREVEEAINYGERELFQGTEADPSPGGDPEVRARLDSLPAGELRNRIRRRDEALARVRSAEDRAETHPGPAPVPGRPDREAGAGDRPLWAVLALGGGALLTLVAVGLTLALGGATDASPAPGWFPTLPLILGGAGLVALIFGGGALREWSRNAREVEREADRRRREQAAHATRIAELRAEATAAAEQVDQSLRGIPLREERGALPDESIASEIEALRAQLDRADRLRDEISELEAEQWEFAAELEALLDALPGDRDDLHGGGGAPLRTLTRLEAEMERVEERIERKRESLTRLEAVRAERQRASEQVEAATRALGDLHALLEAAAPSGDGPEARAREAADRLEALSEARHVERQLIRDHGSVASVRAGVLALSEDPEAASSIEEMEERVRALTEELGDLRERGAELRTEESTLLEGETVDRVEGAILRLQEERTEVREERDRLRILARIVKTAEREFRETHQPKLIRRAETYLGRITGGRYTNLILGDEETPDALLLRAPHLPDALPVGEPISTGTREQVFLALRLAVLELIEGDGEPLPLILDEALVNWDPERRGWALELLAELSRERQIFLFTCHAPMAREVEARGGALLRLPPPGSVRGSGAVADAATGSGSGSGGEVG
ncbi:MAG: hypothetical protein EA351_05855 [Gemmatimonadales bacterium]|nr:MAG: hypothetical protein EA351_05855 [Gemmatimonadales bacterium]